MFNKSHHKQSEGVLDFTLCLLGDNSQKSGVFGFALCLRRGMPTVTKQKADRGLLSLPFVILRIVVQFAAPLLADVLVLRTVSKSFQHVMSSPSMVAHVRATLSKVWALPDLLGDYAQALQWVQAHQVTHLRPVSSMPSIRRLVLRRGTVDSQTLNDALKNLHHLESLDVSGCASLSNIARLPTTLRELNVSSCRYLRSLPKGRLNLTYLNANFCIHLNMLPDCLPLLQTLKKLKCPAPLPASPLNSLTTHYDPDVSLYRSMEKLVMYNCAEDTVDFVKPLAKLVTLTINFQRSASSLSLVALGQLQHLATLELQNNVTDAHARALSLLPKLTSLDVSSSELTDAGLGTLRHLNKMSIDNEEREGVTTDGLRLLTTLRELHLRNCTGVGDLRGLQDLTNLRTLCLSGCSELRNVRALARLNLQTLEFDSCPSLRSLSGLNESSTLEHLTVLCCGHVESLTELLPFKSLKRLTLCDHVRHEVVEPFADIKVDFE